MKKCGEIQRNHDKKNEGHGINQKWRSPCNIKIELFFCYWLCKFLHVKKSFIKFQTVYLKNDRVTQTSAGALCNPQISSWEKQTLTLIVDAWWIHRLRVGPMVVPTLIEYNLNSRQNTHPLSKYVLTNHGSLSVGSQLTFFGK